MLALNRNHALKEAGKGFLVSAVGGVAGVAAVGKIMPAISNKLLAATASGATIGASTSAMAAAIRVVERGEDLVAAAKEVALASMIGAGVGGFSGGALFGVSRVLTRYPSEKLPSNGPLIAKEAKDFAQFRNSITLPFPERPIHAGDMRNYARQLDSKLDEFAAHLKTTDPKFGAHVDKLRAQLSQAHAGHDPILLARVERQIRQGLSGEFAEAYVREMFRPCFDTVTTQKRVHDGATIIDMVFHGARHRIGFKGHGLVEKGGSLPVEVKAGSEQYFRSEMDSGHLLRQVSGHAGFGKGLVITTRDVGDAIMKTGKARQILKDAGSAPYRLLPRKEKLDATLIRLVENTPDSPVVSAPRSRGGGTQTSLSNLIPTTLPAQCSCCG